jgi:phosphoserine phosphatase
VPDTVLTLIASEAARPRIDDAIAVVRAALDELGARPGPVDRLAPGTACDVFFTELDPDLADAASRRALADAFTGLPVDLVVQPAEGRRKRLLLADMESTVIENEMLDELADFLGLRAEVAEITRQAMNDEIDFVAALEARVALLKDLPETMLDTAATRIRVTPGAAALVATMRAQGATTALVSGGFRTFTGLVRGRLGFDLDIANELIVSDGRLAGTVGRPIVTRETKLAALKTLSAERSLPLSATLAVGDGANDLPMLDAAGLGVAFRAKPVVAARARARIDHGDLFALLYAQGYRAAEIVAG